MFFSSKLEVCQVLAKSNFHFFYVEIQIKFVEIQKKKAQNP